jgi:hypothetical protein
MDYVTRARKVLEKRRRAPDAFTLNTHSEISEEKEIPKTYDSSSAAVRRCEESEQSEDRELTLPPWPHQAEADALVADLKRELDRTRATCPGGEFPAVTAGAVSLWLEVIHNYVADWRLEQARGGDALDLLRRAAGRCLDAARRGAKEVRGARV